MTINEWWYLGRARAHAELVPVGGVGPITVGTHQHVLGLPLQLGRGVPQLLEGVIAVSLVKF